MGVCASAVESKGDHNAIGKTKTAILVRETRNPLAILTEIFAQAVPLAPHTRVIYSGPVTLDEKTASHVETVIFPIVDRITQSLGLPSKGFSISIANVGASAAKGAGLRITGFSADIPFLMAMLSASLQAGLRQNIMATGHIASLAGEVVPVLGIPAKIEAAIAYGHVDEFLFPDIGRDVSAATLMPREDLIEEKKSFLSLQEGIKLTSIMDIHDALRAFFSDGAVILSSLDQGYFRAEHFYGSDDNPLNRSIGFFLEKHEERFWSALKDLLFSQEVERTKSLLRSFIEYHLHKEHYPLHFGEQLYRLAISLPMLKRRLNDLFPILTVDQCIALSSYASSSDHPDVQTLYKLTSVEGLIKLPETAAFDANESSYGEEPEEQTLRKIFLELSEANLAKKIGLSLDEGRASYPMNQVTVASALEFNQAITGFYIHLMRHIQSPDGHISWEAASAEAMDRVENAFHNVGGYPTALAEAKAATKGGLRYVFDMMTDGEKSVRMEKYRNMVLKEAIDPLDWDTKVRLSSHIKKQYDRSLPDLLKSMRPEQLAHRLEEAIRLLTEGAKDLNRWIRTH